MDSFDCNCLQKTESKQKKKVFEGGEQEGAGERGQHDGLGPGWRDRGGRHEQGTKKRVCWVTKDIGAGSSREGIFSGLAVPLG